MSTADLKGFKVDYVFIDPPFGANLNYSELSSLWEYWLKARTNNLKEAIENSSQGKGIGEYRQLMVECFKKAYEVTKPGRWMTIEFSNTKAAVWNSIQTALTEAGFIVANVSDLDKKQGSFKAVTTPTAVKQDLVISAYKPNGGFEDRFELEAQSEDGVWDFVRTHLKYLPIVKKQGHDLIAIPEIVSYIQANSFSTEAPSQEQVSHAAAVVVEHVLSRPVKLRHGFGKQLLKSLLEEPNFLDDQHTAVMAFTKDILPRLDESIYGWLLDNYWEELEQIADDSSTAIFFRRGTWFSRTMLLEVGVDVFSHDDWHDRSSRFQKILMRVCSIAEIFKELGKRAQDSLVGLIVAESSTRASVLKHLLTLRQQERFVQPV